MPDLPPPPVAPPAPGLASALQRWPLLRARLPASMGAVGAAAALLVVVAIGWSAWARTAPRPPELSLPRAAPANAPDARLAAVDGEPSVVHVTGAVARPGVYRLPASARVADAIDAAGGPGEGADVDALNLAAKVADGERVYVPRVGEQPPSAVPAASQRGADAPAPLDLNTATAAELEALPGIGPSTAEAIVAYRTEKGRFRSVDELLEVRGIGESKLAELRPKVRVR